MKILLIGDICRDVFIEGECDRLSPERPVAIFNALSIRENFGMAGNVEANLRSLSPDAEIRTLYPEEVSIKTRYVDKASNQHLLRVDDDKKCQPLGSTIFIDTLEEFKPNAVVLADYAKGFLDRNNMRAILGLCQNRDVPTFLDTKGILSSWSEPATIVKINQVEFDNQIRAGVKPWKECQNLITTKGGAGVDLYTNGSDIPVSSMPGNKVDVADSVGAGDSFNAALAIRYLETSGNIWQAIEFANRVAAIAVSRKGVVAVKRSELTPVNKVFYNIPDKFPLSYFCHPVHPNPEKLPTPLHIGRKVSFRDRRGDGKSFKTGVIMQHYIDGDHCSGSFGEAKYAIKCDDDGEFFSTPVRYCKLLND